MTLPYHIGLQCKLLTSHCLQRVSSRFEDFYHMIDNVNHIIKLWLD